MIRNLLIGELRLTIDIIFGILAGEVILRLRLAEKLLQFISRYLKLNSVIALAVAVSAGSSRTGAGIISSALEKNIITEREAIWSILMLPFPSYLKRWFSTLALSISMAGLAGGIFALFLLMRSAARFFVAFLVLRCESRNNENFSQEKISFSSNAPQFHNKKFQFKRFQFKRLFKNLILGWLFFAVTFALIPVIENFFKKIFLSGWTIAAASIMNVSAALALAGGSLSSGELNTSQALFMLILGSALGTFTRILRQNAGYYFGMFNSQIALKMLILNFITIMPFIILSLIFSGLALVL